MSSAYSRWWEGRTEWDKISALSRNIARTLWLHVPEQKPSSTVQPSDTDTKQYAITLLHAFAVALKHHLRGQRDWDKLDELKKLLSHLPHVCLPPLPFGSSSLTNTVPLGLRHRLHQPPGADNAAHRGVPRARAADTAGGYTGVYASAAVHRQPHSVHLSVREAPTHADPAGIQHRHLAYRVDLRAGATKPAVRHTRVDECGRDDADGVCALCSVRGRAGNREREFAPVRVWVRG